MEWKLDKAGLTSAFLQTGLAAYGVYVRQPRKSKMRSTNFWLLLTAPYGLINASAKWQQPSDKVMFDLGLKQWQQTPELFYLQRNKRLILVFAQIIEDLKVTGSDSSSDWLINKFNDTFKLGTIPSGPGRMRFFGINLEQADEFTVQTDAEEKLEDVMEYQLTGMRSKESDEPLNEI